MNANRNASRNSSRNLNSETSKQDSQSIAGSQGNKTKEKDQDLKNIRAYQLGKNLEQELERQRRKEELSKAQADKSVRQEVRGAFGLMLQLGTTMVVSMGIGVFFGRYLDNKFDTSPACLIIFSLLGGAAAIKVMYDSVRKRWSDDTNDTNEKGH